jgi:protein-tyrosine phosphatase
MRGMRPSRQHAILFVCLGNICRSPTAEAVLRAAAQRAGIAARLTIDSAGTGQWHVGNPPDWRAVEHAARRGYDLTPLRARQVTREDFARFDWILAMDRHNLADLARLRPAGWGGHLGLFLDLAPELGQRDVPDPYDGGEEGFETVLDLVERASDALVARLRDGGAGRASA